MTGSWSVGPVSPEPEWKRRVELWMEDGRLTAEMVPLLRVLPTRDEERRIGHLGPDLCGAQPPDLDVVTVRLQHDPDALLAAALLDQRNVAGFGNLYAVELPFVVGVSPFHPIGRVESLDVLVGLGTAVIRTNARLGPQNTTGRRMRDSDHWIYARAGRGCPVCGTRLAGMDERTSPWGRVTTWCPTCQPAPDPTSTRPVDLVRADRLLALHPARREPTWPSRVADRSAQPRQAEPSA
ncbi:MAG: hypothetical protein R2705_19535 [Ilumatobacteraceae bacterium]